MFTCRNFPYMNIPPEADAGGVDYLEEGVYLDAEKLGEFLMEVGKQLEDGDRLTLKGEGWEIPFEFSEPIELEIEFDGDENELEIELELTGEGEVRRKRLVDD